MTTAVASRTSALAGVTSYAGRTVPHTSTLAGALVVAPPQTKHSRVSQLSAEVTYAVASPVPRMSTLAALVTYSTGTPVAQRSLAWEFTLDGHTMYALDLGEQGTFLYDLITGGWCKWETQGNVGWNVRNGTMWNNQGAPRIVGGDSTGPYVWELDPTALFDDGFRDIEHACTGGIELRSRVFLSLAELRVACSAGILDDTAGAAYMQLNFSDDNGQTYKGPFTVMLQTGVTPDGQQDIKFDSLGAFMAPGRIFQILDVGGVLRIDGVDAMLEDYDSAQEVGNPPGVVLP